MSCPNSRGPARLAGWILGALALAGQAVAAPPDRDAVRAAVDRSAGYLLRTHLESGRFVYIRDLSWQPGQGSGTPRYNLLRHAGTMYSLERYHALGGDARVPPALDSAAAELGRFIAPVAKAPWTSALWSDASRLGGDPAKASYAKLGGAGLGLVALCGMLKNDPDPARLETARALARFLVFMQRGDGGFHSRYRPESGFDESWHSLYYPGEAVLGLLSLHEIDPDPIWLAAAERGIRYLVDLRADGIDVPPDHWILVATARYLTLREPPDSLRAPLRRHTILVAESLMSQAQRDPSDAFLLGALQRHGEIAGTGTRLEGLFAALQILKGQQLGTRRKIRAATDAGVGFLLRIQARGGPMDGAFARLGRPIPDPHSPEALERNARATEVRVDYVQHAMTALIDYLESAPEPDEALP